MRSALTNRVDKLSRIIKKEKIELKITRGLLINDNGTIKRELLNERTVVL